MELTIALDIGAALLAPTSDAAAGLTGSGPMQQLFPSVTDASQAPNVAAAAAGTAGTSATSGGGGTRSGSGNDGKGPSSSDLAHSMGQDTALGAAFGAAKTAPGVSAGAGTALTMITAAGVGAEGIIHIKKSRGISSGNTNAGREALAAAGVTW